MPSINKVLLIGRVGKDPVVKTFQNGGRVANFSLATSEKWKDKATGEKKEATQWHNVAVFNENLIKVVEAYVKKGSEVYLEGQVETRKYTDQAGQERYVTEIVLRPYRGEIKLFSSADPVKPAASGPAYSAGAKEAVTQDQELDDSIPF